MKITNSIIKTKKVYDKNFIRKRMEEYQNGEY